MYTFKTEVQLDITGSHNQEPASGKVFIEWTVDIEMREYGIKSFGLSVPDQEVTTVVNKYNEETDEEYEEEITLKLKDVKIEYQDNSILPSGLYPLKLEVYQNTAILEFV